MRTDITHARKACFTGRDGLNAADGQPAQIDGKDHDQHKTKPEARNRIKGERTGGQKAVANRSGICSGDDAEQ